MRNKKIVLVGGGSGIARRLATDAAEAGATVVLAGRTTDQAGTVHPAITTARVDLGDEDSIRALAAQAGPWDHLVSLASNPANGAVTGLDRDAIARAFDAKVIGPLLLAKHFAPTAHDGASMLFFSGFAAWRPAPGLAVMATTNGAVAHLAEALAVDLAPIRVNALSPGVVDSGSWDRLGADRDAFFSDTAARNPARRVGRPEDIASAALLTLANPFLTGTTVHVDGGGRLV
ncbi:SDR family oxidoreductase [Amycolatopsis decaplanina]|uniref:SDR family oxidoreductase n=1 Tax=Amycolatopsis decaplanina TaxID=208441 RepID=UPI001F2012DD|nr:SDR family oxidoreductase [Amycolatopsis decaplanina]